MEEIRFHFDFERVFFLFFFSKIRSFVDQDYNERVKHSRTGEHFKGAVQLAWWQQQVHKITFL